MGKRWLPAAATAALVLFGACVSRSPTTVIAGPGTSSPSGPTAELAVAAAALPVAASAPAGGDARDRTSAGDKTGAAERARDGERRGSPAPGESEPASPQSAASVASAGKRRIPSAGAQGSPRPTARGAVPGASQPMIAADYPPAATGGPSLASAPSHAATIASAPTAAASASVPEPPASTSFEPGAKLPIASAPSASAAASKPSSAASAALAASATACAASASACERKECCNRNELSFALQKVFEFRSAGDSIAFGVWFLILVTLVIGAVVVAPAIKLLLQQRKGSDRSDAKGLRWHLTVIGSAILLLIALLFWMRDAPPVPTPVAIPAPPVIVTVPPSQAASSVQGVASGMESALLRLSTEVSELKRQVANDSPFPAMLVGALALTGFFAGGILAGAVATGLLGVRYASRLERAQRKAKDLPPMSDEQVSLVRKAQLELDRLLVVVERDSQREPAGPETISLDGLKKALSALLDFTPKPRGKSKPDLFGSPSVVTGDTVAAATSATPSARPSVLSTFDWLDTPNDAARVSVVALRSQLLSALQQVDAAIDALVARSAQAQSQLLASMRELRKVTSRLEAATPPAATG